MPCGEALRSAVRLEIESLLEQPRMTAKPGRCRLPAPVQRVQAQALERGKGDPLRHALGEPLLTASFAAGEHSDQTHDERRGRGSTQSDQYELLRARWSEGVGRS